MSLKRLMIPKKASPMIFPFAESRSNLCSKVILLLQSRMLGWKTGQEQNRIIARSSVNHVFLGHGDLAINCW